MFYHLQNLFWGVFVPGVFVLGVFVRGVFVGGICPGFFCPDTFSAIGLAKKYCIIDLKLELLAININMPNYFRHLCFFFCPVNNKWFHSNLPV